MWYFNQTMVEDYTDQLPNFFELVDNMDWTFDNMIAACEIVSHPNDGDDLMNSAILFTIIIHHLFDLCKDSAFCLLCESAKAAY